jgi:hypothetical protein
MMAVEASERCFAVAAGRQLERRRRARLAGEVAECEQHDGEVASRHDRHGGEYTRVRLCDALLGAPSARYVGDMTKKGRTPLWQRSTSPRREHDEVER